MKQHALCPAPFSRRGLALLNGPQGRLYSVEYLEQNQPDIAVPLSSEISRQRILLVLGIKCLVLALQATLEQSKVFLRRVKPCG